MHWCCPFSTNSKLGDRRSGEDLRQIVGDRHFSLLHLSTMDGSRRGSVCGQPTWIQFAGCRHDLRALERKLQCELERAWRTESEDARP
jgi:hypothetical protein